MSLAAGTRLDRYDLLEAIGQGAMGIVYRARDLRLGREVAIKVLPADFSADPDRLRRFDQEARAAGALNHPNVVTIHDVGTHEGKPYVVTELLDGATLRERMASGAMPVRRALEIGIQIARGLAAAHAKGIVHRDLKPENLFVSKGGTVKILDFGLAKLTRDEHGPLRAGDSLAASMTEAGMLMGTIGYMAPEQVRGLPVDHRADLFALGCVLFELVTGARAFSRSSPIETLSAILNDDVEDFPFAVKAAAPGLVTLVRRALQKEPVERFDSARDLGYSLEMLLGAAEVAPGERAEAIETRELAFRRITFRRGAILSARFTPDGHSVVYGAAWEGQPPELFSARIGNPESGTLGFRDADLLAISPTGEMAVMLRLRFVSTFDRRGTLARIPPLGRAARELLHDVHAADWSPDGSQLAVVRDKGGTMRLEYPIGRVLHETVGWVGAFRVSPDGERVAVSDHASRVSDDGAIVTIDRQGEKRVLSEGWGTVRGLAWAPSGKEVWFSADRGGAARGLYAVTLEGSVRRVLQLASNTTIHDIAPDGRVLLSHGPERSGISGQASGESHERDFSWLDWTLLHDISPDGRMMLISESAEGGGDLGSVYVRPFDGSPAVRIGDGTCFAFSPDGEWVVARQWQDDALVLLPTGVGEQRQIMGGDLRCHAAVFLADGKHVVIGASALGAGARLYRLDIESGDRVPISPEGIDTMDLRVLPNGTQVACSLGDSGYHLFDVAGGEPRPVEGLSKEDRIVRWSGDGRHIYVWRHNEIPAKVHRVDAETGDRSVWRVLTPPDPTGIYRIGRLQISADGSAYAYTYYLHMIDLHVIEGLR